MLTDPFDVGVQRPAGGSWGQLVAEREDCWRCAAKPAVNSRVGLCSDCYSELREQ